MKKIHFVVALTIIAIFCVAVVCYFLEPYLESGSVIALFVGLLAFIGTIFINFYTIENSKENIRMQLKHNDGKKSLIKLRLMLNELNRKNHLGFPKETIDKTSKYLVYASQNNLEDYFYEEFIEIFEKFKESDDIIIIILFLKSLRLLLIQQFIRIMSLSI